MQISDVAVIVTYNQLFSTFSITFQTFKQIVYTEYKRVVLVWGYQ